MDDDLYLEINDEYKTVDFFDVEENYSEYHKDKRCNTISVSVKHSSGETVAFLECILFFDDEIAETGDNLVSVADDELTDDAYEAMLILEGLGFLNRDERNDLFFLLATLPISTVYVKHVAVRDDYRKKSIGAWLIRNLRAIIKINYKTIPGIAIVKLFPERITWGESDPDFSPDLDMSETDDSSEMFKTMKKLFEANGFVRHEDSPFFIRDYAGEIE